MPLVREASALAGDAAVLINCLNRDLLDLGISKIIFSHHCQCKNH
jgi:hypothetical protein